MFKDAYIRDNNRIKPDEAFLERLKETVAEEKVVYIDDYAAVDEKTDRVKVKRRHIAKIRNVASLVACLLLVCVTVFYLGRMNTDTEGSGLEADARLIFNDWKSDFFGTADEETLISDEYQSQYDMLYKKFQNQNVRVYEMVAFEDEELDLQNKQKLLECASELGHDERDELVSNILAERYVLTESEADFSSKEYYVAEFEDDSFICFVIGDEKYIYVKVLLDVQSLAYVE